MENIESSLETLLVEFNRDIKRNCDSGRSKQELEERYKSIMKQYIDKFSSALEAFNLSSNSNQDYLYSEFSVINKHFEKVISEHGFSTADTMVRQNNFEFERNLELIAETAISSDDKKYGISQNSRRKSSIMEDEKDDSKKQDKKDSEKFEDYLHDFSSNVISHSLRVTTGYLSQREYMLMAAAAEANAQGLKNHITQLNKSMVEAYAQALLTHTSSVHEYYNEKNQEYLSAILDTVEKAKDMDNSPFAPVSKEVQERLRRVSENARQFKENSPAKKQPNPPLSLPDDIII